MKTKWYFSLVCVFFTLIFLTISNQNAFSQQGTISGRVTDSSQNGIANVDVGYCNETGYCSNTSWTQTDNDGNYTLTAPVGDWKVLFNPRAAGEYYLSQWYNNASNSNDATSVLVTAGNPTSGINAQLETGGAISGTVTNSSGNGIAEVDVGYCNSTGYCFNWTRTGSSGNYTLIARAGSWKVWFHPWAAGGNYVSEWYDNQSKPGTALDVPVTAGVTTKGINVQLETGGTITGKVTDALPPNTGIADVNVGRCDSTGYCFNWTQTDSNGDYTLIAPAGSWKVSFNPWAAAGNYASEWYDNKKNSSTADGVPVTVGNPTANINAQLERGGTISGTVTDDHGQTLAYVPVGVNNSDLGYGGCTDASGSYTIRGISPGTYRVMAGGKNGCIENGTDYAVMYYVNTPDWSTATELTLIAGQTLSGINISGIVPGATVSGRVTGIDPVTNQIVGLAYVHVNISADGWGTGGCTDTNGNYAISGISPGTYRISAGGRNWCDESKPAYAQVYYVDANSTTPNYSYATLVTLGEGETRSGINFSNMFLGATVSGKVTGAGGTPLPNVMVSVSGDGWGFGDCTDTTGDYMITGIYPGTFNVSAGGNTNCPGGTYYNQVFYNNKTDWSSATPVTLGAGGTKSDINFSDLVPAAAISGNLSGDPIIGVKNINVVLHDSQGRLVAFSTTPPDGSGYYLFGGLTPGQSYTVKIYDPFLYYQYKESGPIQASLGTLIKLNIALTKMNPTGTNLPSFNSLPQVYVYRSGDQEYVNLSAEITDPSGCQPSSIKSVTVVDPAGKLHYLYHQKYQAMVDRGIPYGESWNNSRDNALSYFPTTPEPEKLPVPAGDYTFTILDMDGNRVSQTVNLGSYTNNKLAIPTLSSPAHGTTVNTNTPTLNWGAVFGAARYQVRILEMGERIYRANVNSTSFIVPSEILSPGRWYSWQVIAMDSANSDLVDYRSNSSTINFRTADGTTPIFQALAVNIVHWVSGSPLIPHDAYAGHETTLKAVVKGGTPPYSYTWDFGDNTSQSYPANNSRNLEAKHQYTTSATNLFNAIVTVTDNAGASDTAIYPVKFSTNPSRGVKVNVAIDDALWWLHKNLIVFTSDGKDYAYLPGGNSAGTIAMALQAWVLNGHKPGGDPNNPYTESALRAKNFILGQLFPVCIAPEPIAGTTKTRNPDFIPTGSTTGNGQGLYVKNGHRLYETGLVLMALSTLKDPNLVDTVQDLVDYLAYAQVEPDAGGGRGGWRYDTNYRESDMSVTQFPLVGLEAAEHHMGGMGVTIPSYVKEELKNNFLYFVQNKEQGGSNLGGFGYSWPNGWVNVAKTGAGLVGLALTGFDYSDPRVTSALQFIDANWNVALRDQWNNEFFNIDDLYAMYAVMKGMKSYEMRGIDTTHIGGHDWYEEYAKWAIQNQQGTGYWQSPENVNSYGPFVDTLFGVLLLLPQVFDIGPAAVAQASPISVETYQSVTFNHSASFHRDNSKFIVSYAWDFNGDGIVDFTTGSKNPVTFTYTTPGTYTARLTVTDSAGLTDTDQVTITVTEAPFILATIKIEPETLNLGAKGVFTVFITLPGNTNYTLANIDTSSLRCDGAPVVNTNLAANKLIAKFNVEDLKGVLAGDKVTLTVTGKFKDGRPFRGFDMIRVMSKKK